MGANANDAWAGAGIAPPFSRFREEVNAAAGPSSTAITLADQARPADPVLEEKQELVEAS